jgi:hypothetical protein
MLAQPGWHGCFAVQKVPVKDLPYYIHLGGGLLICAETLTGPSAHDALSQMESMRLLSFTESSLLLMSNSAIPYSVIVKSVERLSHVIIM